MRRQIAFACIATWIMCTMVSGAINPSTGPLLGTYLQQTLIDRNQTIAALSAISSQLSQIAPPFPACDEYHTTALHTDLHRMLTSGLQYAAAMRTALEADLSSRTVSEKSSNTILCPVTDQDPGYFCPGELQALAARGVGLSSLKARESLMAGRRAFSSDLPGRLPLPSGALRAYFAGVAGITTFSRAALVRLPAGSEGDTDPRLRPWFVAGGFDAKRVAIVVELSPRMTPSQLDASVDAAAALLAGLGYLDHVSVLVYSGQDRSSPACLAQEGAAVASPANVAGLVAFLRAARARVPAGTEDDPEEDAHAASDALGSSHEGALQEAFAGLYGNGEVPGLADLPMPANTWWRVLLWVNGGGPSSAASKLAFGLANKAIPAKFASKALTLHALAVTGRMRDAGAGRDAACAMRGIFTTVDPSGKGDSASAVRTVLEAVARADIRSSSKGRLVPEPVWSVPYADAFTGETVLTVSVPVYNTSAASLVDNVRPALIGTFAVDYLFESIAPRIRHYSHAVPGAYAMLYDAFGRVYEHPLLSRRSATGRPSPPASTAALEPLTVAEAEGAAFAAVAFTIPASSSTAEPAYRAPSGTRVVPAKGLANVASGGGVAASPAEYYCSALGGSALTPLFVCSVYPGNLLCSSPGAVLRWPAPSQRPNSGVLSPWEGLAAAAGGVAPTPGSAARVWPSLTSLHLPASVFERPERYVARAGSPGALAEEVESMLLQASASSWSPPASSAGEAGSPIELRPAGASDPATNPVFRAIAVLGTAVNRLWTTTLWDPAQHPRLLAVLPNGVEFTHPATAAPGSAGAPAPASLAEARAWNAATDTAWYPLATASPGELVGGPLTEDPLVPGRAVLTLALALASVTGATAAPVVTLAASLPWTIVRDAIERFLSLQAGVSCSSSSSTACILVNSMTQVLSHSKVDLAASRDAGDPSQPGFANSLLVREPLLASALSARGFLGYDKERTPSEWGRADAGRIAMSVPGSTTAIVGPCGTGSGTVLTPVRITSQLFLLVVENYAQLAASVTSLSTLSCAQDGWTPVVPWTAERFTRPTCALLFGTNRAAGGDWRPEAPLAYPPAAASVSVLQFSPSTIPADAPLRDGQFCPLGSKRLLSSAHKADLPVVISVALCVPLTILVGVIIRKVVRLRLFKKISQAREARRREILEGLGLPFPEPGAYKAPKTAPAIPAYVPPPPGPAPPPMTPAPLPFQQPQFQHQHQHQQQFHNNFRPPPPMPFQPFPQQYPPRQPYPQQPYPQQPYMPPHQNHPPQFYRMAAKKRTFGF